MNGILKTEVEVIKFDGTNQAEIIERLRITNHIPSYFKKKDVYFIIPKYDEGSWFILDEPLFGRRIELICGRS